MQIELQLTYPLRGATNTIHIFVRMPPATTHAPKDGQRIASRYMTRILENLSVCSNSLTNLYNSRNPHRDGLCQVPAKIEEQIGEKYTANRDSCMKKGTPTRRQGRLLGSFSCLPAADTSSSVLPRRPTRC